MLFRSEYYIIFNYFPQLGFSEISYSNVPVKATASLLLYLEDINSANIIQFCYRLMAIFLLMNRKLFTQIWFRYGSVRFSSLYRVKLLVN